MTAGEIGDVPAVAKTQTTTAGTGDKICCWEPVGTVAVTGACGTEAGLVAQQGILPPQSHRCAGWLAHGMGTAIAAICPPRNNRLHKMVSVIFTFESSAIRPPVAGRILPFRHHFLSGLSAARIFFRYFAGSLSKSFLQSGQQNFTSWPL